jgi:hypothetical protein
MQPLTAFSRTKRKGRVVVATSPNPTHTKTFSKENLPANLYMPTWDWENLYCARRVPELDFSSLGTQPRSSLLEVLEGPPFATARNHKKILQDAYRKFAGIPRICFYYLDPKANEPTSAMRTHQKKVNNAITNTDDMSSFIRAIGDVKPPILRPI